MMGAVVASLPLPLPSGESGLRGTVEVVAGEAATVVVPDSWVSYRTRGLVRGFEPLVVVVVEVGGSGGR